MFIYFRIPMFGVNENAGVEKMLRNRMSTKLIVLSFRGQQGLYRSSY